jgi:hypothetical protein
MCWKDQIMSASEMNQGSTLISNLHHTTLGPL